jgi:hypothetical protein
MLSSAAMTRSRSARLLATALATTLLVAGLAACKRGQEPQPDYLKTQRDAMERAKKVGDTMQKAVDREGKKADEEGR